MGALQSFFIRTGDVEAEVIPARGGLVARLVVVGRQVLFLDRATVEDPTRSVRGGIPVLFPFAGRLAGDTFKDTGTVMKQHGHARNHPWEVTEQRDGFLRMTLTMNDAIRAAWPWPHALTQTCLLTPRGIHVELCMENRGDTPMPVSPGWHPYFTCTGALKNTVTSDVPGHEPARLDPAAEFDFGIPTPPSARCTFNVPGLGVLRLEHDPAMRHLQHWSLPGRDFVCLEPFWGDNNTINTTARMEVPPGQARSVFMRIELLEPAQG